MKIHFFLGTTFPFGMAGTKRVHCYAKGLIANGDKICIHVCHRFYKKDDTDNLPSSGLYNEIEYNYPSGKIKSQYKFKRGLDYYFLDSVKVFFYALYNVKRGERMFVYLYPIFTQILLLIVAFLKKAKIVKETCEHPSSIGNPNSKWHKLCKWFEYHFVMPYYDGFIPISTELQKFVDKYKKDKAKSIIVPILVDNAILNLDFKSVEPPYNVPFIIHTGTMLEQKDSISKIIKAFAKYKQTYKSKIKLVFTGPQANDRCKYIPLMKDLNVFDDIELLGLISVDQVVYLQHFAAMTIIYKSDNLQTRNCFPTKLGEMLMNRIPVITTTVGDANLYLVNGESALIFEPDDDDKLIEYIHVLLTDKDKAIRIGERGHDVAEECFNPYFQGKRLHDFYESL